jgi:O-antigen/teichoic acid export membrane protein
MRADLATAPASADVRAGTGAHDALGPLTRRASFNAAAALLDYTTRIGVGLVVTPLLVSGLGRTLFGVWEMLSRIATYMHATDGRPTEALKLVIAQRQTHPDDEAKRRYLGAALAVWLLVSPVVLATGAALVWIAPKLTKVPPEMATEVRITAALLVLSFMLESLASAPDSILRGMNLAYRRMGLQSLLNIAGGVLAAGAVLAGLGLTGLAGAQIVRAALTGLCFFLLARTFVKWFGAARPHLHEVKSLFGMSVWLSAGNVVSKIGLASDVVILGAVAEPALVATYVLTGYAARVATGMHVLTASAAVPGLGGLLGAGELERARQARAELLLLTWLYVTAIGTTILLWNRAFLSLWVGGENYADGMVNLLIVLVAVQTAFVRVDAYIIDASLRPRKRVLVGALAALVTVGLSIVFTRAYGLVGLCVAILVGRSVQTLAYPLLARTSLGRVRSSLGALDTARLVLVTALLFTSAAVLGDRITPGGWVAWTAGVAASVLLISALALLLGLSGSARTVVMRRVQILLHTGLRR